MKRFKFTLEPVLKYKIVLERQQKAELSGARAVLRTLIEADEELTRRYEESCLTLEAALEAREHVVEALREHDRFFIRNREERAALAIKIAEQEREIERLQNILIATMREIKVYNKLRAEQYARYLVEAAAEDERAINDTLSFTITTSAT
jgi:flagellar export protein FliJ